VDVFRTPDERFADLPGYGFEPRYVEQDGLRMHYVDEGAGEPVLLLHGEPTWAYLYRTIIAALTPTHRVVAPDYVGFGRSDKPTDVGWYSYDRHVASIESLVEELALEHLTIVVQDWGGPIGLRLAVERPELVDRLVLLNTGIGAGRAPSETWLRFREMVRRVGTEIQPSRLIAVSLVQPPGDGVLDAYDAPFPAPESRAGIVAFPEHVPTELDHPNAEKMNAVRAALREWEKPALVLFGDSDPIFSPRDAERLAALIPGAGPAEILAGAGHFVQEDRGAAVGARIARWLATDG
jgi:haloalkane dehalogenase